MVFSKHYDHETEKEIYEYWHKNWFFAPEEKENDDRETFFISMPPPNVTWVLHIWHSMMLALEDAMVRFHRMKWKKTLWIPGTDHAGIATQVVVEKNILAKTWKSRHDLWRINFTEKVWDWVSYSRSTILSQVKQMGASCDWWREQFTLSEKLSRSVRKIFKEMHAEKKIYRDSYIVNRCTRCKTVLSDLEVDYKEKDWKLIYIKYFIVSKWDSLTVATTRPETIFADVAIAVNPRDRRYKKFIWKMAYIPIINKEIPIIWDDDVDPVFGTWALKITPTHDPDDFVIAKRHKLPKDIYAIDNDWKLTKEAWNLEWLDANDCLETLLIYLEDIWNLEKVEDYTNKVPLCGRCGCVIQPMVSSQWFVRVQESVNKCINVVSKKEVEIIPSRFEKVYYSWMEKIRPWCISRQLRWWHRMPVWYCKKKHVNVFDEDDIFDNFCENIGKNDNEWKSNGNVWLEMMIFNVVADGRMQNPFNIEQVIDVLYSKSLTSWCDKVWQAFMESYKIKLANHLKKQSSHKQILSKQFEQLIIVLDSVLSWEIEKIALAWEELADWLDNSKFVVLNNDTYKLLIPCKRCWSEKLTQDEDVLDTWFSSALWPFSILGRPEDTQDMRDYYPNTVLETWYDILFFWVSRMMIMWNMTFDEKKNWIPFKKVFLHWLVKDETGNKMSKSKWNTVNPLDIINQWWADALRLTLLLWVTPWNDLKFSQSKVEYNRRFLDKLWNASRYVHAQLNLTDEKIDLDNLRKVILANVDKLNHFDQWILMQLDNMIDITNTWMEKFQFGESWLHIQRFIWNKFCDWYLEITKKEKSEFTDTVLLYSLWTVLKLLHPLVPFITERLWHKLWFEWALIISSFPEKVNLEWNLQKIDTFVDIIIALRSLKQDSWIKPHQEVNIFIEKSELIDDLVIKYWKLINHLMKWKDIVRDEMKTMNFTMVSWIKVGILVVEESIDLKEKLKQLTSALEDEEQFLQWVRNLLASSWFAQKANPMVVEQKIQKKNDVESKILKIKEEIAKIKMRI